MKQPSEFAWDYMIDKDTFVDILKGRRTLGRLDAQWATQRLLEYAPYSEVHRYLSFGEFAQRWPAIRHHIRSESRRRGYDFLLSWLNDHHPEWLADG